MVWFAKYKIKLPADLPMGAVLGVCEITDVVEGTQGKRFGKWFFGPVGWVVMNARALPKPINARGKLGLARASRRLVRNVKNQLRRK
jgi:hypothetical protein